MAELLGLGMTHFPPLAGLDERMAGILKGTLRDPDLPEHIKNPANWPLAMQMEWGTDEGKTAAAKHRAALLDGMRRVRAELDAFRPDFVVIWGDDQYENFTEDIVPAFCVLAYDNIQAQPWRLKAPGMPGSANVWRESLDYYYSIRCHREGAKFLVSGLLSQGFDIAYAYQPLHLHGIGHAFLNSVAYLDYDRKGFEHPLVCVTVNCYGRKLNSHKGGASKFGQMPSVEQLDPPSPTPTRCFDLGAATARILAESPYRVALVASSSWSHAFLHDKGWHIFPDMDADRALYQALRDADYGKWRNTPLSAIEDSGQQEMLNWFCLVGAMAELTRKPAWSLWLESYAFNSNKCFAVFPDSA